MPRNGTAQPVLRRAWRGMSAAFGVSSEDMYAILASLRGAHAGHALALRDPVDVVDAWDATKRVLRLASQWQWVQKKWPRLGGGCLERWIVERDMELGVCQGDIVQPRGRRCQCYPPPRRAQKREVFNFLEHLAEECEDALTALKKEESHSTPFTAHRLSPH